MPNLKKESDCSRFSYLKKQIADGKNHDNGEDMENLNRYRDFVRSLAKPGNEIVSEITPIDAHRLHMAIGISGEAGELLDAIKKATIYRKPLDIANVREECGDLLF